MCLHSIAELRDGRVLVGERETGQQIRRVDLEGRPRVDDRSVLRRERVGEIEQIRRLGAVIPAFREPQDCARRRGGMKPLVVADVLGLDRPIEPLELPPERVLADVADRSCRDRTADVLGVAEQRRAVLRIVLEVGGPLARSRPLAEPRKPVRDVDRVRDPALFAVVDDVEPRFVCIRTASRIAVSTCRSNSSVPLAAGSSSSSRSDSGRGRLPTWVVRISRSAIVRVCGPYQ